MPKIHEILLNLEGFHYDTSLDLHIGYYHICIYKEASNICTIILPWIKYKNKCLPMVVCKSMDIF